MAKIVDDLDKGTNIIKILGQSLLSDGRTLSEALTIDGIPYWEVFAVELARIYIPAALANNNKSSIFTRAIKPYMVRVKYALRNYARLRGNPQNSHSWPTSEAILCLDFSEHIGRDVLQPVVRNLAEMEGKQLVCLRDKPWNYSDVYEHKNIQYQTIWHYWNWDLKIYVYSVRSKIKRVTRYLRESNDLKNNISNIDPILWKKLEVVFNRFFIADLYMLVSNAAVARHILKQHRPSLVISGDVADPRTRVFILQCKNLGVPCLEVQFGLIGPEGIEWQFFVADVVAVWGEDAKATMISHGIPENKIIITGTPRNDCLTKATEGEIKSARQKLGIPEGNTIILLASAYQLKSYDKYSNPNLLSAMKKAVFEAVNNSNNISLIVKPHPSEDENETKSFANSKKNIIFVSRDDDIRELTKICDCFISFGSTATVDALILGKFVICPVFPGWVWSDLFKNTGAVYTPSSAKEVLETFELISTGKYVKVMAQLETARKEIVQQWIYRNDGHGAERVAKLGLSLLN